MSETKLATKLEGVVKFRNRANFFLIYIYIYISYKTKMCTVVVWLPLPYEKLQVGCEISQLLRNLLGHSTTTKN